VPQEVPFVRDTFTGLACALVRQGTLIFRTAIPINVHGWPTLYVVDHRGVIRHKWVGFPGEESFDSAIDNLVEAALKDQGHPPEPAKSGTTKKGAG